LKLSSATVQAGIRFLFGDCLAGQIL